MSTNVKAIRAYVQPYSIARLTQRLLEIKDFPGMSVWDCEGFGREKSTSGQDYVPFYAKKCIEIFAPATLVEEIVRAIIQIAHSGQHGDGKIYIEEVQEGIRLSTLERGANIA